MSVEPSSSLSLADLRTNLQLELRVANAMALSLERSESIDHGSARLLQEIERQVLSLWELHATSTDKINAIDAALAALVRTRVNG